MTLRELLLRNGSTKQGDWVECGGMKGIFIANKSSQECVIATYKDKKKICMTVESSTLKPIERISDTGLYVFAQKHIMWSKGK